MPILDHFGIIAPIYDKVFDRTMDHSTLSDLLDLPEGGYLLDAGGGTGRVSQIFSKQAGMVVVGDESLEMLQESREKEGLSAVGTHTEALPFGDETFDGIIMVDALHHVTRQADSVEEMWRVLKTGGKMVIEEPDIRTFNVKMLAVAEKLLLMRSHFLSPPEILALVPGKYSDGEIVSEGFNAWVVVKK